LPSRPIATRRGDSGYADAVGLMIGEANAAIDGAFEGGATEVVVNDSHGGMFNLRPAELDRRARVIQGQKAWSMVEGAGPDG
jgi:D-amino peptidase